MERARKGGEASCLGGGAAKLGEKWGKGRKLPKEG